MERVNQIETKRPEAILFDLGSTLLLDSLSGGLNTRVRSLLKRDTFATYVEKDFDLPTTLADTMDTIYRDGLEEFHVREWLVSHIKTDSLDSAGSPETLERHIRTTILSYTPPVDSGRVLRELMDLDIPMGVVSNSIFSAELLREDLVALSVIEAFQFVVSSAEFGLRKPHPAIFTDAVDKLNARPETTWYVGDLWENDVLGSTGAGLIPVWLNAHAETPEDAVPHHRARNWTELGELLGV